MESKRAGYMFLINGRYRQINSNKETTDDFHRQQATCGFWRVMSQDEDDARRQTEQPIADHLGELFACDLSKTRRLVHKTARGWG